jgi:hypothetical protein
MKTTLYQLRPFVAGILGRQTVWAKPTREKPHGPCDVRSAHYEFEEWHGDCLISAAPVYAVTVETVGRLKSAGITGYSTEPMKMSFSAIYTQSGSPPQGAVPPFLRLLPLGKVRADPRRPLVLEWTGEDICDGNVGLVVTQKALDILRACGLHGSIIRPVYYES